MGTKTTIDDVWKILKELGKAQKETEDARREGEKVLREAQQRTEDAQQKTEKALQELTKTVNKTTEEVNKTTENLNKASGDFRNKWGQFLENLVHGDLKKLLKSRNIEVVRVQPRMVYSENGKDAGDFDLVAVNGREIVAVEVKSILTVEKVKKFLKALKKFKEYFPEFKDRVVYGGVAYLGEPQNDRAKGAAKFAKENGLFVIISPGGESNVTTILNPDDFRPKAF